MSGATSCSPCQHCDRMATALGPCTLLGSDSSQITCTCNFGYIGDGTFCVPTPSCPLGYALIAGKSLLPNQFHEMIFLCSSPIDLFWKHNFPILVPSLSIGNFNSLFDPNPYSLESSLDDRLFTPESYQCSSSAGGRLYAGGGPGYGSRPIKIKLVRE